MLTATASLRIGQQTGRIAKALGMTVLASGSRPTDSGREIAEYVELDELLARADVIALHCPLFPVITNCSTSATWDSTWGEAVCMADATAVLKNSLIAYNTGHRVGGVRIRAAREFSNCTIVSNVARKACGGVQTDNGANRPQTCVNNIVWGNLAPTNPNLDDVLIFSYSCGVELVGGTGNVTSDPKFRNPSRGDWRLRASSPCVSKTSGHLLKHSSNAAALPI